MKRNHRFALLLPVLFLITGCSFTPDSPFQAPVIITQQQAHHSADYHMSFVRGDETRMLLIHLESEDNYMALAGFGVLGEALFDCRGDNKSVDCNSMVEAIPAKMLFENIQLIFAPLADLQAAAKPDISITQPPKRRVITDDGKIFATVAYDQPDIWTAHIVFKNEKYDYTLSLRPLNVETVQDGQ